MVCFGARNVSLTLSVRRSAPTMRWVTVSALSSLHMRSVRSCRAAAVVEATSSSGPALQSLQGCSRWVVVKRSTEGGRFDQSPYSKTGWGVMMFQHQLT